MDVDALREARRQDWEQLEQLARRRRLDGPSVDRLVHLYQETNADLSSVRTQAPDPDMIASLSKRVAGGRARLTSARTLRLTDLVRYFTVSLPLALYRLRWWVHGMAAVFVIIALVQGWWLATNPDAMDMLGSESSRKYYAEQAFEGYYSANPALDFGAMVWTNNARIALLTIGLAVTGVGPAWILVTNASAVGQSGAIMAEFGYLGKFLSLIAPHGLLELTSVFVACAAGTKLAWSVLVPGPKRRITALGSAGRSFVTVAGGLVIALAVSGVLEAFVTPSALPSAVKIALGALALAAFWLYAYVVGGRAHRAGMSADLEEARAGYGFAEAG
ncbi:stage II sporulation protein M [Buchananella felis]|uniref:stage II sporulation protein M n=1 Tax=Buchananella felis TaxID=3231492 RepID=UPI00352715B4